MGILAFHAQNFSPLELGPLTIAGTKSMPLIWITAIFVSALAAFVIGLLSLRTTGVYFIMITLAFGQMFFFFSISWSAYGGEDGLSIYVRNGFPGLNTLVPIQFFGLCFAALLPCAFRSLETSGFSLRAGSERGAADTGTGRDSGSQPDAAQACGFRDFRRGDRSGRRAFCGPQSVRQPDDVQLAAFGRVDHPDYHWRCRTSGRTGHRGPRSLSRWNIGWVA